MNTVQWQRRKIIHHKCAIYSMTMAPYIIHNVWRHTLSMWQMSLSYKMEIQNVLNVWRHTLSLSYRMELQNGICHHKCAIYSMTMAPYIHRHLPFCSSMTMALYIHCHTFNDNRAVIFNEKCHYTLQWQWRCIFSDICHSVVQWQWRCVFIAIHSMTIALL